VTVKEKEKLFKHLARHHDSMDYPPIMLYRNVKRESIKSAWRKRIVEISRGALDYPGMYIHVPYCQTKCFFCKFRTRVGNSEKITGRYLDCLKEEIKDFAPLFKKVGFKTLYLGGGTPTIFSASQLDTLFTALEKEFNLKDTFQRLIESSPATLNPEKIGVIKKHGFNRLTIGVQAVDRKVLDSINRRNQTVEMVRDVFFAARSAGIEVINLDLILGLPGQSGYSFLKDLDFILRLKPEAVHIYSYEEDREAVFVRAGRMATRKEKAGAVKLLRLADREIKKYGYRYYRNEPYLLFPRAANFQFQFRYSINGSLLGIGAGALSYIPNHFAYHNTGLDDYLKCRRGKNLPAHVEGYRLNSGESRINYVINNIRAGVDKARYLELYKSDFDKEFRGNMAALKKLDRLQESEGLVRVAVKDNFEFRTYSKFFFSQKVVKELQKRAWSSE